jgi:hypothetical protein
MSERTAIDNNDPWPRESNREAGTYHDNPPGRQPETTHVPLILGPSVLTDGKQCPLCGCYEPHVCMGSDK